MTLKMYKIIQENENLSKVPIMNFPLIHVPKTRSLNPTNIKGIDLTDLKLLASTLKKVENWDDSENSEKYQCLDNWTVCHSYSNYAS